MGLVLRSPELARQVTSLLDDVSTDGSYRLELDPDGQILWSTGEPGAQRFWRNDPETTFGQRILLRILAPFAPEELL